jgi:dynein heavy chain
MKKQLQPNKMNIFTLYLARVKKNMHIVIGMSPIGDAFTTRLRMFPSLINCCTIDWFTEWPEEALEGVGRGQLMESAEELGIDVANSRLVDMFKYMHKSVERTSNDYRNELRRINYVTPTSYLEVLSLYKRIVEEKRRELKNQTMRLKNGLDKLNAANKSVDEMKIDLQDM